jgi:F0F1-type ATP synthase assembly protein I
MTSPAPISDDGQKLMTVPAAVNNLRMTQRWLRVQSLVGLALAALAYLMAGGIAAYSSLFGSLAAFLPALLFALIVARRFGADSKAFLRAAVLAEVAKWLLCAAICIAVFVGVKPLAAGWFFVGMGCVILAGWLGLILSS